MFICVDVHIHVFIMNIFTYIVHTYTYIVYIHIYYIYICIFKRSHPPLSVAFANKNVRQKC